MNNMEAVMKIYYLSGMTEKDWSAQDNLSLADINKEEHVSKKTFRSQLNTLKNIIIKKGA